MLERHYSFDADVHNLCLHSLRLAFTSFDYVVPLRYVEDSTCKFLSHSPLHEHFWTAFTAEIFLSVIFNYYQLKLEFIWRKLHTRMIKCASQKIKLTLIMTAN